MTASITHDQVQLIHHFTRYLGRWLDCTNASRIFTLAVSEKAFESPVLANAVVCFSARHQRRFSAAEEAYEKCITLLIQRLGAGSDTFDECLLSAVLLLHFADQLECTIPLLFFISVSVSQLQLESSRNKRVLRAPTRIARSKSIVK